MPKREVLVRAAGAAMVLAAALTAAACTYSTPAAALPFAVPDRFTASGSTPVPDKWWLSLGDPALNGLVDQALAGNLSLQATWERLAQAEALARSSAAPLYPTLDGSGGVSRTVMKTKGVGKTYATEVSLGLTAGYEVDLWGRIRSAADAARLDAEASAEDLRAAALTLSAQVAGTWYSLVELRGQLALLDQQIDTNSDYLDVTTFQFRRGLVSATDVLQQRQVVESRRGDRALVESSLAVREHQLAVLLGRVPARFEAPSGTELPGLQPLPATGLPTEWVQRRPDIRAAFARVRAADERVAVALAERFPRLSLSASAATTAEDVHDLFDNWIAGIAANMLAPILDGGQRKAEFDRARSALLEELNSCGQAVLDSIGEVEDALAQEARQSDYLASLGKQLDLSDRATQQTRENYVKGSMDFTRFLTTLIAHQNLQRNHLTARRQLVQYRIDLCRALAGGWELARPPAGVAQAGAASSPSDNREEPARGNEHVG